jgi:hypothetical protein
VIMSGIAAPQGAIRAEPRLTRADPPAWTVALSPLAVEVCRSGQSGAAAVPVRVRVQAWSVLFHSW